MALGWQVLTCPALDEEPGQAALVSPRPQPAEGIQWLLHTAPPKVRLYSDVCIELLGPQRT